MHMMGAGVTDHHKDWIPSRMAHTGTGPAPLGCSGHQREAFLDKLLSTFAFASGVKGTLIVKKNTTPLRFCQGTKEEMDTWFYRGGFLLAPIPTTALMLQQCPWHRGSGAVWGCQQLPPAGAWCQEHRDGVPHSARVTRYHQGKFLSLAEQHIALGSNTCAASTREPRRLQLAQTFPLIAEESLSCSA